MFVDQHSFDYFSWKLMPPKSVWINVIMQYNYAAVNKSQFTSQIDARTLKWHFRASRFQNFLQPLNYDSCLLFQSRLPTSKHFETPDPVAWFQKSTTKTHFETKFWRNTSQNTPFCLAVLCCPFYCWCQVDINFKEFYISTISYFSNRCWWNHYYLIYQCKISEKN